MSSMGSGEEAPEPVIETLFTQEIESSEEPPMDEWSSLLLEIPEENVKRIKYEQGLYDPGDGEICTKYIALSASSVFRHPYYNYPAILDPGIKSALLLPEPKIIYPDDGQELYIHLCKEGDLCQINVFHRQLLQEKIDLSYYGINPMAFRAIALSLRLNRNVTVLNLTDNWIDLDGCFHLGEMLVDNITLKELNLYGCRIGPEGARRLFVNLHLNRSVRKINLGNNGIGDIGAEALAKAIFLGSDVTELILYDNELTANAVVALSSAFETNNKLTHLDLSWNKILSPNAICTLCGRLSENFKLQELNLSWNALSGLKVGNGLGVLLKNPHIKHINLSNNKLSTLVVTPIKKSLSKATRLVTLDLSYNPFTPEDALYLLRSLKERRVKLQNLLLDNVIVTEDFTNELKKILALSYRKKTVVTHGYVQKKFVSQGVDMRELVLDRIDAVCKRSKKRKIDFALVIQEMNKLDLGPLDAKLFVREMKNYGVPLDDDLIATLFTVFPYPKRGKVPFISLPDMVEYFKRKWPDRKLPPTPPPEPEPEPVPKKAKKEKKKK